MRRVLAVLRGEGGRLCAEFLPGFLPGEQEETRRAVCYSSPTPTGGDAQSSVSSSPTPTGGDAQSSYSSLHTHGRRRAEQCCRCCTPTVACRTVLYTHGSMPDSMYTRKTTLRRAGTYTRRTTLRRAGSYHARREAPLRRETPLMHGGIPWVYTGIYHPGNPLCCTSSLHYRTQCTPSTALRGVLSRYGAD